MNKTLALIPVAFAIFALMLSPAVMSVSADKGGNDKAQGTPKGCDNGKGKDDVQNPNCGTTGPIDTDGDGVPDGVEDASGCMNSNNSDTDGDGVPDGVEDANHNGIVESGETNPCDDQSY